MGVTEKVTKQHKPKSEKPMLYRRRSWSYWKRMSVWMRCWNSGSRRNPERRRAILGGCQTGRIDELMQKLGLSYDDDEEEEKTRSKKT